MIKRLLRARGSRFNDIKIYTVSDNDLRVISPRAGGIGVGSETTIVAQNPAYTSAAISVATGMQAHTLQSRLSMVSTAAAVMPNIQHEVIPIQLSFPQHLTEYSAFPPRISRQVYQYDFAHRLLKKISLPKPDQRQRRSDRSRRVSGEKMLNEHVPSEKAANSLSDVLYRILIPNPLLPNAENFTLPSKLFPYQRVGVQFLMEHPSALLADDMGTGKTVMSIVAMRCLFQKATIQRALIVCPRAVVNQWKEHLEKWASDMDDEVIVISGSSGVRQELWRSRKAIAVVTYDILSRDIDSKQEGLSPILRDDDAHFGLVILDEAHRVSNAQTGRSRAVRKAAHHAKYRWALTGTPLQNNLDELHTLYRFVAPDDGRASRSWRDKSRQQIHDLIAPIFLRRTKQEVLPDLPPKTMQELWLEMGREQHDAYIEAQNGFVKDLGEFVGQVNYDKLRYARTVRNNLVRMKQVCNFIPGKYAGVKIDHLLEALHTIKQANAKALIFSQFVEEGVDKIAAVMRTNGLECVVIKGGQSDREREEQIRRFKHSASIHFMVASVKAAGEGLNLTEASYVFHFDHWWNPATMRQAEDRAHRSGQTQPVTVTSYWMEDTIDRKIYRLLAQKAALFNEIMDDVEQISPDNLLPEEWMAIIAPSPKQQSRVTPIHYSENSPPHEEIIKKLRECSPSQFEEFIAELFRRQGYRSVKVTGGAGDRGVDIRGREPGGQEIAIQCKRYKNNITPEVVREFIGAMDGTGIKVGFLIATSDFSTACEEASKQGDRAIHLIGQIELSRLVIKYNLYNPRDGFAPFKLDETP